MKEAIETDSENALSHTNICANPWNGKCDCTDIIVYILRGGKRIPICQSCCHEIAETTVEWSED